ncbi:MAG: class I SAM-dependent methyltransferase [Bacteroidota bacterium]
MSYKDNFSTQSSQYQKFRPHYSPEIYAFILEQSLGKALLWDCATGNGQVVRALAPHFQKVWASDASAAQLSKAPAIPNVHYHQGLASESGLAAQSCDLITVAQALHWFAEDAFYDEVRRVARPGAQLITWGYGLMHIQPQVDALVSYVYKDILGDKFWDPERKLVEAKYETIYFPFENLASPTFQITYEWNLEQVLGYINTWSAFQKYLVQSSENPLEALRSEFEKVWGPQLESKRVTWDIFMKRAQL